MKMRKGMLALTAFAALILFSGCQKEDDTNLDGLVTEEEAAYAVEYAVSSETGGLSTTTLTAASVAGTYGAGKWCGVSKDSSFSLSKSKGGASYTYANQWSWVVNCSQLKVPESVDFKANATGQYTTAVVSSSGNTGVATVKITGLTPASAPYNLAGGYIHKGTAAMQIGKKATFTSDVTVNFSDLKVSKTTYQIESGSATFTVSGASSLGQSYSYSGAIQFNGNGTATLTLGGKTYPITL
ncbi:MAG: hypothetical protein IPN20_09390 [Haliscomenobacter sp.]|nr:hypothetical protein [Haliscomenobacter sp.]